MTTQPAPVVDIEALRQHRIRVMTLRLIELIIERPITKRVTA